MNASINRKILSTLAGMLVLLVIASLVGLMGVNRLGGTIRFITDQAWNAADGAMEGTIGLQQELLAVNLHLRGEADSATMAADVQQARTLADTAFARMKESGLMPETAVSAVLADIATYRELGDKVVAAHRRFTQQRARATSLLAEMDLVLEKAEEAVETNMDAGRISQQTDVDTLWDFADGLMETRIMLLNGLRLFESAVRDGELTVATRAEIAKTERHAVEQVAVIAASPLARSPATGPAQPLAQIITQLFGAYREAFGAALNSLEEYRQQAQVLRVHTSALLDAIEALEEVGDSQVEGVLAEVDQTIGQAVMTIVITLLIALAVVGLAIVVVRRTVLKPLQQAVDRMRDIAAGEGDLTITLPENGKDELAQLGHWFNQFLGQLRTLVGEITSSLETLNGAAQTLATVSTQTDRTVDQQNSETSSVAAAMTEMSATVKDVAHNATSTAEATLTAEDHARRGDQVVRETMQAIEALAERVDLTAQVIQGLNQDSTAIGSVVDVIRSVAEQTNLLALNAAIEAARAGEQGRGFAVVADEVRTLAGRTQQSTTEIQAMIEKLQSGTVQAVELMNKSHQQAEQTVDQARAAGEALEAITQSSQQVRDMSVQIATASEEQAVVSEEVSRSVTLIQDVTQETAQGTAEIQSAAVELSEMAERLEQMVMKFKT